MKLSVGLKVSNSLSLTPQLQQAIRLLQLSSLELEQEIQIQLDSNPLLEKVEEQSSIESLSSVQEQEQDKKDQQNQNQQQQQQNKDEMSKENAQQLLNAVMQDEKNVQDKVKKQLQIQGKKLDKDW